MKGEVHKRLQGTDSYTSCTFQNGLVRAGPLCGISTNAIRFYGQEEEEKKDERKENSIRHEDGACPEKTS